MPDRASLITPGDAVLVISADPQEPDQKGILVQWQGDNALVQLDRKPAGDHRAYSRSRILSAANGRQPADAAEPPSAEPPSADPPSADPLDRLVQIMTDLIDRSLASISNCQQREIAARDRRAALRDRIKRLNKAVRVLRVPTSGLGGSRPGSAPIGSHNRGGRGRSADDSEAQPEGSRERRVASWTPERRAKQARTIQRVNLRKKLAAGIPLALPPELS